LHKEVESNIGAQHGQSVANKIQNVGEDTVGIRRDQTKISTVQLPAGPSIHNIGGRGTGSIGTVYPINPAVDDRGTIATASIDIVIPDPRHHYTKITLNNATPTINIIDLIVGLSSIFTLDFTNLIALTSITFVPALSNAPTFDLGIGARNILHIVGHRTTSETRYEVIQGGSGGGGSVPLGTIENQHLEWDNTSLSWNAVQGSTYGATGPFATSGFLNFANDQIMLSARNVGDSGDISLKINSSDKFIFEFPGSVVPLEISATFIDVKTVDLLNVDRLTFADSENSPISNSDVTIYEDNAQSMVLNVATADSFKFTFNNVTGIRFFHDTTFDFVELQILSDLNNVNSKPLISMQNRTTLPLSTLVQNTISFDGTRTGNTANVQYAFIQSNYENVVVGTHAGSLFLGVAENGIASSNDYIRLNDGNLNRIEFFRDIDVNQNAIIFDGETAGNTPTPPASERSLFVNSATGEMSVKKSDTSVVSLEGGGAANAISQLNTSLTITDTGINGKIEFLRDGVQNFVLDNSGFFQLTNTTGFKMLSFANTMTAFYSENTFSMDVTAGNTFKLTIGGATKFQVISTQVDYNVPIFMNNQSIVEILSLGFNNDGTVSMQTNSLTGIGTEFQFIAVPAGGGGAVKFFVDAVGAPIFTVNDKSVQLLDGAGDVGSPVDGEFWYNGTTNKFRARENGSTVNMINAGGGGEVFTWTANHNAANNNLLDLNQLQLTGPTGDTVFGLLTADSSGITLNAQVVGDTIDFGAHDGTAVKNLLRLSASAGGNGDLSFSNDMSSMSMSGAIIQFAGAINFSGPTVRPAIFAVGNDMRLTVGVNAAWEFNDGQAVVKIDANNGIQIFQVAGVLSGALKGVNAATDIFELKVATNVNFIMTANGAAFFEQISSSSALRFVGIAGMRLDTDFVDLNDITSNPATPAPGFARLFVFVSGANQTLRVKFDNGVVKDIATDV